jgi:hypothetical protein
MSNNPIADDLIWGAAAVGKEIGVDEKRAFYLLGNRLIPGRKIGKIWVVSRGALREALCNGERQAPRAEPVEDGADLSPPWRGRPRKKR